MQENTADILFNYLRDIIYDYKNARLDIDTLPEEFHDFAKGLQYFSECLSEARDFSMALAKGDLTAKLPAKGNELAAPLKGLQASLKHLSWQTQQIARGDYMQRIDFMGDFAKSFNMMVELLEEREKRLKSIINRIEKKSTSLEQSNRLLTALMHHVPQQMIVINQDTREILLMNDNAMDVANSDPNYLNYLMHFVSEEEKSGHSHMVEMPYKPENTGKTRYFLIKTYALEWNESNAEILSVEDITKSKFKIEELEHFAYQDSLTQLYNRGFGMMTLDVWLEKKLNFVLIFADLDNLKYINDEFGHGEGDAFIENCAKHLRTFDSKALACRIGGDEFMLLARDFSYDEAHQNMMKLYENFKKDPHAIENNLEYSLSFGIIEVNEQNTRSASDILSIADERMYENKRMRKRERKKRVD